MIVYSKDKFNKVVRKGLTPVYRKFPPVVETDFKGLYWRVYINDHESPEYFLNEREADINIRGICRALEEEGYKAEQLRFDPEE